MAKKRNASKAIEVKQQPVLLPAKGLKCEKDILPILPFARSTLWSWAASGKFPAPRRVHGVTAWSLEEVWAWLEKYGCTPPTDEAA